jgi:hypothetical protein
MKRNVGAVLAVATCLLVVVAFAAGRSNAVGGTVLRADRLELMSAGKVAAVLHATPAGLQVRGPDGRVRAMVGFVADGVPALGLFDESGSANISLSMTSDGQAEIHLANEDGTGSLSLIAPPKGGPGLYLEGDKGRSSVALDDAGNLVTYRGCGVEPHVIAPAS